MDQRPDTLADHPEAFLRTMTEDIWNRRRVDVLLDRYADDVILRAPGSVLQGNGTIVAATLSMLSEFPDHEVLTEDVIWVPTRAQQADGTRGTVFSHRMLARATHQGSGAFASATGRSVLYPSLADLWCADGTVRDVWLIRDQSAILRQIGQDPRAWVQEHLAQADGVAVAATVLTPDSDPDGPYRGTGARGESADRLADALKEVMAGDLSAVARLWDPACAGSYPGGTAGHGHRDAEAFWLGLRSAFPSAAFRVDHRIGREDPGRPPRASVRWSLYGRHDGWGSFGTPSGAYVYIMGITQAEFGPYDLHREWSLIDETAIWTQIELARG